MDDSSIYLLILCVIGFILIAPIVALVRISRVNRRSANRDELESLKQHVEFLDRKTRELEAQLQGRPAATSAPSPVAVPPAAPPPTAPPPVVAAPPPTVQPVWAAPPPTSDVPPAPIPAVPSSPPEVPPQVAMRTEWPAPPEQEPRLVRTGSSPFGDSASSSGASADSKERWENLEERLGANWLNKIGTAVFVIGIALFLSYTIRHLGPAGKIAMGYAAGLALIALGIIGERRERYRLAARSVLGGGWAVLYFATYAMHSIAAVRLVASPALGFLLLFAVAAVMVAHSLRYHSQVTTGFAYLLAFASVAVNSISRSHARRQRDSRRFACSHSAQARVVRHRALRDRRHVSDSLAVAATNLHRDRRPQTFSRISRQPGAAHDLLGDLDHFLFSPPGRRGR